MSLKEEKPTFEKLLKKIKEQELEINHLLSSKDSITNFEFYFKKSLDLVCIAGMDGFFKEVNPAFTKILGYSKKELLSKSLLTFIHSDDVEKTQKEIDALSLGNSTINFENRLVKKNGGIVNVQWTTSVNSSKEIIYAIGRDITEIKRVQADLLQSEFLLENAQKISKIGSWEYNYNENKMYWSKELYSIYELKKKKNQDLFQEYVNRFSKSDVELFLNKIKKSKIDKKPFDVEQRAIISKNRTKWVYATVYPIVDEKGFVIALRGNTQDITEKKQIREELKLKKQAEVAQKIKIVEDESNEKFKSYIENSPDGVIVVDENGKYVEVNNTAVEMSGYTKEELLKMTLSEFLITDYEHNLYDFFEILKKVGSAKGEIKTKIKSGEIRWRAISAIKLSETRFIGFVKDITDLKLANELLTNTFDRISDAFIALDNNWCYTYMNHKAGEILNRKPDEMIGKHIWTEFPNSKNGKFYTECYNASKNQEYIHFEEYNNKNKIWLENNIYPSPNGLSIFFRNITNEKTTNDRIEESEKRFRALVENNDGIITVVDKNLKVLFRSPSSAKVTGYTDKEFEEITNKEYFHPDYLQYIYQIIQKSINNPDKLIPALLQAKHKNGHYIWLEGVVKNKFHDSNVNGIIVNFRDVTNKIESEALLKKERDFFAKIAATSPGLIYSMRQNLDGSICYPYASDAIKEIYGFSFEQIENHPNKIFDLVHPEDIDNLKQKIINTKRNLVPLKGEYRYIHPTKGLVWHEVNSLPIKEPGGAVICHGIISDITERILAKQKILKANRLYLFISQINQMIVRTTNQETLFKEACKIAVELGKFKMAWIGLIDPNTKNIYPVMVTGSDQKYLEIIKTITTDENTIEGRGPTGTAAREGIYIVCNDIENDLKMAPWKEEALIRGFKASMSLPIKKFEKVIGVFNFYADEEIALLEEATGDVAFALEVFEKEKLKEKAELEVFESELRYHTLTEVSPVGIFRTNAIGYTTYVNPTWSEISGLSFEEAIGNGWLDAVHNEDKLRILNGWENASYIGEKSLSEYRFVRPDGSISWVLGQAIPEKNSDNIIIGYIGTITDITDRKVLENNMITAKVEAETANKAKSNFLANMSHEIRTPLNGILGFTHLLMKTELNENQLDYMTTINESASSLLDIVNDILDFSKIESGKLELNIEQINLYKLINQIIDLFKFQAINKNIKLVFSIDKNVSQFILADSIKIKQILVNLLSNALKFTENGKIRLDVTEEQTIKKNYVLLSKKTIQQIENLVVLV
jgi:PAS domain S-box-containing protein